MNDGESRTAGFGQAQKEDGEVKYIKTIKGSFRILDPCEG